MKGAMYVLFHGPVPLSLLEKGTMDTLNMKEACICVLCGRKLLGMRNTCIISFNLGVCGHVWKCLNSK